MKGIAIYPALVMPALVTRDLVHHRRTACYGFYGYKLGKSLENSEKLGKLLEDSGKLGKLLEFFGKSENKYNFLDILLDILDIYLKFYTFLLNLRTSWLKSIYIWTFKNKLP